MKRFNGKDTDRNAELIVWRKLQVALRTKKIRIPRSGYLLQVAGGKLRVKTL
jgi:hypothetical protein